MGCQGLPLAPKLNKKEHTKAIGSSDRMDEWNKGMTSKITNKIVNHSSTWVPGIEDEKMMLMT